MMTPLKLPKPVKVILTNDELRHLEKMTDEIYSCPRRNSQKRSWDEVSRDCYSGVILEFALERQGGKRNPGEFNHRVCTSHNWDVDWMGWRHEVKSCLNPETIPDNGKYETNPKWVNISSSKAKKIIKNRKMYPGCVDTILFGYYNKISERVYDCKWRAIIPADTVLSSLRKSNFNDHFYINAFADRDIIINPVEKLLNEEVL